MTQEEKNERELEIKRRLDRFPVISKDVMERAEKRLYHHLMQELQEERFDDKEAKETEFRQDFGNEKVFGQKSETPPPMPGMPWSIEARYPVFASVEKAKMRTKYVTLRVWDDIKLDRSIAINQRMVQSVTDGGVKKDALLEVMTVTVVMWLRLRGQFFWLQRENVDTRDSSESMYFDGKDRKLMKINSGEFRDWLFGHSGISPANERAWKQMFESVKAASTNPDVSRPCVPGNLFDRRGDRIYISNGSQYMARVSPGKVEIVDNGTDGIVFAVGKTLKEWTLLPEEEGRDPFDGTQLFGGANYESKHGKMILRLWFLSLASCLKNYPALLFVGRYRSGKSRTAQGVLELLGVPKALGAIRDNGEEDFWATLNGGGVTCFDNVDSSNKWIGDAMQLACTGGSTQRRKLFTDNEISVLSANAKIMMTSNNPQFASVSGLSDRLQTVLLGPFTAKVGKESKDSELTREIEDIRSAAFTWMAYTLSRALADHDVVAKNVNRRHPDYADFALRCSRALSLYDEGLEALQAAEFNKAIISLQNDRLTNMIYESLRREIESVGSWTGTASNMLELIKRNFETDDWDRMLTNRAIGKVMNKHIDEFFTCFTGNHPKEYCGRTQYTFNGFTQEFITNCGKTAKNVSGSVSASLPGLDPDLAD